ncbi:hypothetical protein TWF281_006211 [Arthrobotrys megalospora]
MPSRTVDSPPKARTVSNQRRRFSIYQRGQEVTVGPLGFDVPINGDRTAFPADEVDEEDRLSGVEYPSSDEDEREVKRRRIERNARDYLCGRRLNIYSTTLKGPLEKSYWGKKAKVVGTPLEITARGLKKDIIREQRRKSEGTANMRSFTASPRVPVRREKGQRITLSQKLHLSQQPDGEQSIVDSQPSIGVTPTPIHYPSSPLLATKAATPATGKSAHTLLATTDSVKTTKVRLSKCTQQESIVPETSPRSRPNRLTQKSSQSSFIDLTGGDEASGLLLDDGVVFSSSYASPLRQKSKLQTKGTRGRGDSTSKKEVGKARGRSAETEASQPETSQLQEHSTLNIDLDRLGQISKELGLDDSGLVDDTTTFFQNDIKSRRQRDQSPATTLKISLPKVDARKSHNHQAPASPTADAALRKALRPQPIQRRRSDLGHGVSLNDMLARTAASSKTMSRPKQRPRAERDDHGSESKGPASSPSSKTRHSKSPIVEEPHPTVAKEKQPPAPAEVPRVEEYQEVEDEDDMEMVPESPIEKSMSNEPTLEPPNTVTQPPMRLSQMPTPLPPSPLALLNHTKQTAPNIPETVVEEPIEKPPAVDVAVKENEPAFHPGPRRSKKVPPKTRANRLTELKKGSGEETALLARKIATPVSRLHQKIAEFSPISPMIARPDVSPIPESQPQSEIQKSSIRLQERLKEEQQKGSSQLSSPPPSSPPETRNPAVGTVQLEEALVEVPATSKETTTAEPSPVANVPEPAASGAPPSPPQEPQEGEEESTIEISSGRYRKIEESLNNGVSDALPLALVEATISHISATHPGSFADITSVDNDEAAANPDEDMVENTPIGVPEKILESVPSTAVQPIDGNQTDPEGPNKTPRKSPPKEVTPVPGTPPGGTQASRVSVPESFKKAIAAPINYTYNTPGAPLPPPFLPNTTAFTPINSEKVPSSAVSTRIISPASSRVNVTLGPFSTTANDIEFTPFKAVRSPEQPKKTRAPTRPGNSDAIDLEATDPVSPFTFSQFMKPVESQYQVGPAKKHNGASHLDDDKPSSYDLENVLGGVEDFLMSDVYDVDEEAKKLSENPSFGDSGGKGSQRESFRRETRKSQRRF